MNIYKLKMQGWPTAYVTAPKVAQAIARWASFRKSEVLSVERIATQPEGRVDVYIPADNDAPSEAS